MKFRCPSWYVTRRCPLGPFHISLSFSFSFAVSASRVQLQESNKSNILSSFIDASPELPETPSLAQMQRSMPMLMLMLARMADGYSPSWWLSFIGSSEREATHLTFGSYDFENVVSRNITRLTTIELDRIREWRPQSHSKHLDEHVGQYYPRGMK